MVRELPGGEEGESAWTTKQRGSHQRPCLCLGIVTRMPLTPLEPLAVPMTNPRLPISLLSSLLSPLLFPAALREDSCDPSLTTLDDCRLMDSSMMRQAGNFSSVQIKRNPRRDQICPAAPLDLSRLLWYTPCWLYPLWGSPQCRQYRQNDRRAASAQSTTSGAARIPPSAFRGGSELPISRPSTQQPREWSAALLSGALIGTARVSDPVGCLTPGGGGWTDLTAGVCRLAGYAAAPAQRPPSTCPPLPSPFIPVTASYRGRHAIRISPLDERLPQLLSTTLPIRHLHTI